MVCGYRRHNKMSCPQWLVHVSVSNNLSYGGRERLAGTRTHKTLNIRRHFLSLVWSYIDVSHKVVIYPANSAIGPRQYRVLYRKDLTWRTWSRRRPLQLSDLASDLPHSVQLQCHELHRHSETGPSRLLVHVHGTNFHHRFVAFLLLLLLNVNLRHFIQSRF